MQQKKIERLFLTFCTAGREVATSSLCSCLAGLFCSCRVPVSPHVTVAETVGIIGHAVYAEWERSKTFLLVI